MDSPEARAVHEVTMNRRPVGLKALIAVMLALALLAVPSGVLLLLDPSGSVIGGQYILPYITKAINFIHDFTIVGAWLILVYGFLPATLAVGLVRRDRRAWYATLALGGTVILWIATQMVLFYGPLGFTPLYPLIGGIGIAIATLALLPSVRAYFLQTSRAVTKHQ